MADVVAELSADLSNKAAVAAVESSAPAALSAQTPANSPAPAPVSSAAMSTMGLDDMLSALPLRASERDVRGSLSQQRVDALKLQREEARFDSATSSLMDAISNVEATAPAKPRPTPLADAPEGQVVARADFGRGLSVIERFAVGVHGREETAGANASFRLDGTLAQPKARAKEKGRGVQSRKVNRRKAKAKERGVAYAEKSTARGGAGAGQGQGRGKGKSGPSRRGRTRAIRNRHSLV